MESFIAKAVTPDGDKYDRKVQMVVLRTIQGEMGILAHHTDYMGVITPCIVRLTDEKGKEEKAVCGGGFVTCRKGELTIVADYFIFPCEIDKAELENEKAEVTAKLSSCHDKREIAALKSRLARIELKEKII